MEWKPIERVKGSTETREHPRDAALLMLSVRLDRTPPPDWQDRFRYPTYGTLGEGSPKLDGSTVSIAVEDGQEKAGIATIDENIARANHEYERDVLPAVRAQEEQEKRRAEEKNRRLEDARERLKDV